MGFFLNDLLIPYGNICWSTILCWTFNSCPRPSVRPPPLFFFFVSSSSQPSLVPLTTWSCTTSTSASPVPSPFWVLLSIYMLFMSRKRLETPVLFLFSVTSLLSLLLLTNCCSSFMILFPPSPADVSSSSHNLTLSFSCLPVPYFRRSHGFNFYYVLMTHRRILHPWRFVTQSSGCLPPRLFVFDFSISSHSIFQAPSPGWCFQSSLYLVF